MSDAEPVRPVFRRRAAAGPAGACQPARVALRLDVMPAGPHVAEPVGQ